MLDPIPSPGSQPATNSYAQLQAAYGGGMPTAGMAGAYGTSLTPPPYVYLGSAQVSSYDPAAGITYHNGVPSYAQTHHQPQQALVNEAMSTFEKMDAKEQRNMLRLLAVAGFTASYVPVDKIDDYVDGSTLDEARDSYHRLLETASDYYVNSGLKVTPEDVLKSRLSYRLKGIGVKFTGDLGMFDNGISKHIEALASLDTAPKTGTYITTSKSVDFMNPMDAKNMVRATLQQELGRDPTQGEYEDFLSAIHAAEAADPTTQKTTSTYALDNNDQLRLASQNTVTNAGLGAAGAEQVAYQQAQQQPSWAEWQAMSVYAPALFQALGSTVPGA